MPPLGAKLLNLFKKNLISDAVPRGPRPETEEINGELPEENNENYDSTNAQQEETFRDEHDDNGKKSRFSMPFFKSKEKKAYKFPEADKQNGSYNDVNDEASNTTINTQATGPVLNIVKSKNVHCGDTFTYYMSPVVNGSNKTTPSQKKYNDADDEDDDECIEKDNLITMLMEADADVTHEYIEYVSQNIGENWRKVYRCLGFSRIRIETVEADTHGDGGPSEARYKLLLEWTQTADNPTLGQLATLLWEEGKRHLVKEISIIYKKNKK